MKLLFFLAFMVFTNYLCAQQPGEDSFKKFGFQAGANASNMNFNSGSPAPVVPVKADWKAGVTIGVFMRVQLGKKWSLQPEYNYVQRNGGDKSTDISYQLNYLSLPLLLQYNITKLLSVYAGPQGDVLIQASSTSGGVKTSVTHDTEERNLAGVAGFGLQMAKSFFLSARYLQGFNHVGIGQRSSVKEFKYQSVSITAGIRF